MRKLETDVMIQAKGIEKSYGALRVLKGLDVSVEKSEVVAIMGASGAGKTTLLQILGTLSSPDGGSLVIDGIDVLKLDGKALADFRNRRIGFVFQAHHLLPEFTALENVMIPAYIAGRSKKDAQGRATELLSELGNVGDIFSQLALFKEDNGMSAGAFFHAQIDGIQIIVRMGYLYVFLLFKTCQEILVLITYIYKMSHSFSRLFSLL